MTLWLRTVDIAKSLKSDKPWREIQKEVEPYNRFLQEQSYKDRRQREKLKHNRMAKSNQNKYEHAIDTIIERVSTYGDGR